MFSMKVKNMIHVMADLSTAERLIVGTAVLTPLIFMLGELGLLIV